MIAVVGLPRSGTSATVGLLRILGFQLPPQEHKPTCIIGEAERLRAPVGAADVNRIVTALRSLPRNTVWKDPSVGSYAHAIPWRLIDTVIHVVRTPDEVADSERRWQGLEPDQVVERNRRWEATISGAVKPHATITLSGMRENPVGSLVNLARLTGKTVTIGQADQAKAFINAEPGYRCPVPSTCTLH